MNIHHSLSLPSFELINKNNIAAVHASISIDEALAQHDHAAFMTCYEDALLRAAVMKAHGFFRIRQHTTTTTTSNSTSDDDDVVQMMMMRLAGTLHYITLH